MSHETRFPERPTCGSCSFPMWQVDAPLGSKQEHRVYRCPICNVVETMHVARLVPELEKHDTEPTMTKLKVVLALAAAVVVISAFSPAEASARSRRHQEGCFDRLPAYGTDGCGLREFGYGPGSCWRRVEAYTRQGPRARRVYVCG